MITQYKQTFFFIFKLDRRWNRISSFHQMSISSGKIQRSMGSLESGFDRLLSIQFTQCLKMSNSQDFPTLRIWEKKHLVLVRIHFETSSADL